MQADENATEVADAGVSDGTEAEAEAAPANPPTSSLPQLEREGDIAADYLEGLLDIADLDGDIDLDVENDRAMVSIVGGKLDRLIGPGGATLEALQELTRLAVLRETGERSRLMLDIGGTRERRRAALVKVAQEAAQRVREQGTPLALDPMNPFERKVVHDAIAETGLRSESEGVEPNRRIVISPPA
jgi:spoIIIJ-associated protein